MHARIKLMIHNTVETPPVAYRRFRTCDRKKVYADMQAGWNAVRSIQRNGNDPYPDFELRPYECEFCHKIHVGHSNTPRSSEARMRSKAAQTALATI